MKLTTVRTNPQSGFAEFGTIEVPNLESLAAELLDEVPKEPNAAAAPHHPPKGQPILLRVKSGAHTILVPCDGGRREVFRTLGEGDAILFCDFEPDAPPEGDEHFCYAGHRSLVSPGGALLAPARVTETIDLDQLNWAPINLV